MEASIACRDSIKQFCLTNLTWSSSLVLHILKESNAISRMQTRFLTKTHSDAFHIFSETRSILRRVWTCSVEFLLIAYERDFNMKSVETRLIFFQIAFKRVIYKNCVQTRLKTVLRRVQTRFQYETRSDAVRKIFEMRLNAFLVYNAFKRNLKKILTASQRISYWKRVWTRRKTVFNRVSTRFIVKPRFNASI